MGLNIYAECISAMVHEIDKDSEYVEVAFADSEDDLNEYLVIQRQFTPNEQDRALGFDKIYIELNDQGCSTYGEIEQFVLKSNSAEVTLTPETAKVLGVNRNIIIEFSVEPLVFRNLREHIRKLFENNSSILVEDL